jgi:flagellum-specific peptidoglycan hydrolase FlgJ
MSVQDFINTYYSEAAAVSTRELPPAFILAHAYLESGRGQSQLTKKANNFFGIKALPNAPSVTMRTTEIINGKKVVMPQKFAKYESPANGFKAYIQLLSNSRYKKVLQARTNLQRAQQLKAGGYFTAGNDYVKALATTADQFQRLIKARPNTILIAPIIGLLLLTTYLASSKN